MTLTPDDIAQIQAMISGAPTVGEGFAQPIVAGQNLLIPGIQSPNFSIAGQTGWAILKTGQAYFFSITASGTVTATAFIGTNFVINSPGAFFYNGT
ncbi:MAG: hypothetical protein JWO67_2244, partial [Streptosporangiaceae bacterium]|nr:hypothetical protein [Streptosporangiaceae bacterium]